MAFIQVYFNDALEGEVPLRADPSNPVSIGRDPDNDITIDNAGVSALHAVIWQEGGRYVIADAASRNGLLINSEHVQRKVLELGDTVRLPKYTLKFAHESAGCGPLPPAATAAPGAVSQKRTIEVDVSGLGDRLAQRRAAAQALLKWSRPGAGPREYALNKVNVKIGKARQCDIRTGAWLGPAVCATVTRRADGWYVKPEPGGKVRLNGVPIREPSKMSHGDRLALGRCELTFHDAQETAQPRA